MNTNLNTKLSTTYLVDCYDENGFLKWTESTPNIVVNEGVDYLFNSAFLNTDTSNWFAGLVKQGNGLPEDTMQNHSWIEYLGWVNVKRPLLTFEAHSPRTAENNIKTRPVTFTMGTTDTISGAFMTTSEVKDDYTGILYGVTSFESTHSVIPGDSISMSIIIGARQ
jgi:hypothetical protein